MDRKKFLAAGAVAGAAFAAPRFTLAAGNAATIKVGFLDSFSGVFSDLGACHKAGAQLALEDANRGGRVAFEYAFGDDGSKPAVATSEARRLISQENVDVLFGGTSSANGAAISALSLDTGIFFLELGAQDSALTGAKASQLTYRFGPNARMILAPVLRRVVALGKKWYFIQADYALGKDAYAQCTEVLTRAGGTEIGHDIVPLGTADFSSQLTKVKNSDADVLMLCNSGLDAANTAKQFVQFGLNKKMKLAGVSLEDIYYKALPLADVAGATFPVLWAPGVSPAAAKLAARLSKGIAGPISSRHYLGYMAATTLFNRILAAGTTDPVKLAASFDNYSFDAAKSSPAVYHAFDHQCAQDVYAGALSAKQFAKTQNMWEIVGEVPASESDGNPGSPWAKAAQTALSAQKPGTRPAYTAKTI